MLADHTPGVLDKSGRLLTKLSGAEIDELFATAPSAAACCPKISGAPGRRQ